MKVKVMCRKFECREDIHPEGLGVYSRIQPEGLGVAFFATGPGLSVINVYLNDTRISYTLL